jgi:hypothetical protein
MDIQVQVHMIVLVLLVIILLAVCREEEIFFSMCSRAARLHRMTSRFVSWRRRPAVLQMGKRQARIAALVGVRRAARANCARLRPTFATHALQIANLALPSGGEDHAHNARIPIFCTKQVGKIGIVWQAAQVDTSAVVLTLRAALAGVRMAHPWTTMVIAMCFAALLTVQH